MASSFTFNPKTHYLVYTHNPKKGNQRVLPGTAAFNWDPTTNVATLGLKVGNTVWNQGMSRLSTSSTTWSGSYTVGTSPFSVYLTDFTLNVTTISGKASRIPGNVTIAQAPGGEPADPWGPAEDQGSFVGIKQ